MNTYCNSLTRLLRSTALVFLGYCSASCSFWSPAEPNPDVRATVITVASEYLQLVVQGKEDKLSTAVLWEDFLQSSEMTKADFLVQLRSLQKRWTPEQHPLLGLEVLEVRAEKNAAQIALRKLNHRDYPKIEISLSWIGNGWAIADDNLFGKDELVATWQENPQAFR